jgi:hypothetical protein
VDGSLSASPATAPRFAYVAAVERAAVDDRGDSAGARSHSNKMAVASSPGSAADFAEASFSEVPPRSRTRAKRRLRRSKAIGGGVASAAHAMRPATRRVAKSAPLIPGAFAAETGRVDGDDGSGLASREAAGRAGG